MKRFKPYLPEFLGVFIALMALNIWYFSSLAVSESILPKTYEYLIHATTVAMGAFLGAFLAFKFNEQIEAKRIAHTLERDKQREAICIQKALLIMVRQLNALGNLKKTMDNFKTKQALAFAMPAQRNFYGDIYFDVEEISFLVGKSPMLLFEISVEQDSFVQTVGSLEVRNEFFLEKVNPTMEALGLNNRPASYQEIEARLPYPLFKGAIDGVTALSENLTQTLDRLEQKRIELLQLARQEYPNFQFLDVESA
ncbi:hypothetical protein KUV35_01090 [Marinobacter salsuginis]|uniref:hypothetical protein n=1 Tax=Marinobacter salsuginis TaxID=418719 RepID=UPI001C968B73|nr:hypothetical protein [Marinobacter salsuginis]MBY6069875.1 hypothetical protein [Marinobacter salsuginis]